MGDLVICLTETNDNDEILKVYVFYDYKEGKFGIRILNTSQYSNKRKFFSYYSRAKNVLFDFIIAMISNSKDVDVSLLDYHNLPLESDSITFELLENRDSNKVELFGYIYNREYDIKDEDDDDDDDDDSHPKEVLKKMLNIIEEIYNEY
jgi:hypothetical protein